MSAAAEPPQTESFRVDAATTSGRFVARVICSLPRITIPAMVLAIVWQVGESAVPVVMGLAIDRALATSDAGQLVLWVAVLVVLHVALTVAARLSLRLTVSAQQLMQHRLRSTLSARVLHPVGRAARVPDGSVVSVMTNDVARLGAAELVILPIGQIAGIGFIAVSLVTIYWPLGLLVCLGAPLAVWSMGVLSERFSRDTQEYQGLLASTVGKATDLVEGYRVIKGVRAETEATRRYRQASQETLVGAHRNARVLGRFLMSSDAVSAVFVAAVMGLAGWFAVDGALSIGELIASVGLAQALLPQIQSIANGAIPDIAAARASSARILDLLRDPLVQEKDTPQSETEATRTEIAPIPALEVLVSGVTIRVEPGEIVGVRADDQSAARIEEALLDGQGGIDVEVRLDEVAATELTAQQYRSRVTVAPHRVTLFTGTIRDNVTAGAPAPELVDASELVEAAAQAAGCDDFAADLDVSIGEGGNRLSGGQRQRVALARALASRAPVLVLHDPTTAVDSVTEHSIAGRLRDVRADRSTLLLASSPALLGACDRVVELSGSARSLDRTTL